MNTIVATRELAPHVKHFVVEAPRIAAHWHPGQFVIVRVADSGERIPLTIAGIDGDNIELIVQAVGKTTTLMNELGPGEALADVAGPLGHPSGIAHFGTVAVVAGGVGAAIAYPVAAALAAADNDVFAIIGGRSRDYVILEDEMEKAGIEVIACTDDGSYGRPGLVTDALAAEIEGRSIDLVHAVGPVPMMKAVAEVTRPRHITTVVSLNPIMVDGTGMCGGCRVSVGGETLFACVDGPEFDAHAVDFDELARRNSAYEWFEEPRRDELDRCSLGATL